MPTYLHDTTTYLPTYTIYTYIYTIYIFFLFIAIYLLSLASYYVFRPSPTLTRFTRLPSFIAKSCQFFTLIMNDNM